jgi:hypothetical protein
MTQNPEPGQRSHYGTVGSGRKAGVRRDPTRQFQLVQGASAALCIHSNCPQPLVAIKVVLDPRDPSRVEVVEHQALRSFDVVVCALDPAVVAPGSPLRDISDPRAR